MSFVPSRFATERVSFDACVAYCVGYRKKQHPTKCGNQRRAQNSLLSTNRKEIKVKMSKFEGTTAVTTFPNELLDSIDLLTVIFCFCRSFDGHGQPLARHFCQCRSGSFG
jgi:hypothetical protein